MAPEKQDERVLELFHSALELPESEREAYLATECGDDADLFEEVASLLAVDPAKAAMLEHSVDDHLDEALKTIREGEIIGQYRLIRELGRGGHGVVYLAEPADGEVERQVALKLLKRGVDTDEVVRRFRGERQILAGLKHPYIPHLYDAATTDDGRPYFVMEYVEGKPIKEYCQSHRLSIDDRLQLFRKVCEAVQFAHQHFIVHRDLKPSNVLVDESGEPKLLDFGIAKILSPDSSPSLTTANLRVLTPAYASPEQLLRQPITAATDVYSLGVMLFELLAGARPYDLTDYSDQEAQRLVCEEIPVPPSLFVERFTADEKTPMPWEGNSRKWQQELRGDLDTIVLMALNKEPERRYATVGQLSEDVESYLNGLPVEARRPTTAYRLRKFVGRNRLGLAVAMTFFVVVAAFLVNRERLRSEIEFERDQVGQQKERAEEVTDFLIGLFESSDPFINSGEAPTVREVLDTGALRVDEELEGQPELRASIKLAIGQIYRRLGLHEESKKQIEAALPVFESRAAFSGERAEALNNLGILAMKRAAYGQSQQRFLEVHNLLVQDQPTAYSLQADVLSNLAQLSLQKGNFPLAQLQIEEALHLYEKYASDKIAEEFADALTVAGYVQLKLGHIEEARALLDRSLALKESELGPLSPSTADTLNTLGLVFKTEGDYAEAESCYQRALEIREQVLGPEHRSVAITLNNLSVIYSRTERFAEAETTMLRAIKIKEGLYGPDHPSLAKSFHNLGRLYREMGRYGDAEEIYRKALAMFEATVGSEHPSVAGTLNNLGTVFKYSGKLEEAELVYLRALEMRKVIFDKDHPDLAESLQNLGSLYSAQGRFTEALPLLKSSLQIRESVLGESHDLTVLNREQYRTTLARVGTHPPK